MKPTNFNNISTIKISSPTQSGKNHHSDQIYTYDLQAIHKSVFNKPISAPLLTITPNDTPLQISFLSLLNLDWQGLGF